MYTTPKRLFLGGGVTAIALAAAIGLAHAGGYGGPYGFGTTPSAAEIAAVDIDAMPDGRGLPPGSGTYAKGKEVYASTCVACHGAKMEGVKGTGGAALIGGRGSLASGKPKKTVESYWPYATTVFDFVRRAMPFNAPGTLTNDELYSVVAYILGEAKIIGMDDTMDASSLAKVMMPNRDGFIADPRPDVANYD